MNLQGLHLQKNNKRQAASIGGDTPDGALPLFIGGGDQLCW